MTERLTGAATVTTEVKEGLVFEASLVFAKLQMAYKSVPVFAKSTRVLKVSVS